MKKIIPCIILFVLCACGTNPNVKSYRDEAKLEAQLVVDLYLAAYNATQDFLLNPYVDQEKKDIVKREITPKLNQFKRDLIQVFSGLDDPNANDWELLRQVRMLERNMEDLINNMRKIGISVRGLKQ